MVFLPRPARRRFIVLFASLFISFSATYLLLPPSSPIKLSVNFNTSRFWNSLRASTTNRDAWLGRRPAPYPLSLREDVGYIVKTGYGTRHRVPALINAFSHSGDILGEADSNFIVVGDWTATNETLDASPRVHNVVKLMMETKVGPSLQEHSRFGKYRSLQEAIDSADEDKASELGQSFGWELDALKVAHGWKKKAPFPSLLVPPLLDIVLLTSKRSSS
jgi:hypothetical protein